MWQGNVDSVKLLLARGASWEEKDNNGQTALHLCTAHKSSKCMLVLLKYMQPGAIDDQDLSKVWTVHRLLTDTKISFN